MYIYQGEEGYDWRDIIFGTHPCHGRSTPASAGTDEVQVQTLHHASGPAVGDCPTMALCREQRQPQLSTSSLSSELGIEWRTRYMDKTYRDAALRGISLLADSSGRPTAAFRTILPYPTTLKLSMRIPLWNTSITIPLRPTVASTVARRSAPHQPRRCPYMDIQEGPYTAQRGSTTEYFRRKRARQFPAPPAPTAIPRL